MLVTDLKSIGLNRSEITVYLYLLENGISTPPIVSRGTKIARTNCYAILQSLKEKGLVEKQENNKRKSYIASDPDSLLRSWQKKKELIEQLVPDLRNLYTTQKNKPKIRFYEGVEQIKQIYEASLNSEEILAFGFTNQLSTIISGFLDYYFLEIKKRGIIFNDILTNSSASNAVEAKNMLKGFYNFKILPTECKDPPTDILIWKNNIALITLKEPIFGTILTNNLLSETLKIIFKLLWEK